MFEPGRSGSGSNPRNRALRAARSETETCVRALVDVAKDNSAPAELRADAAKTVLRLGFPKLVEVPQV